MTGLFAFLFLCYFSPATDSGLHRHPLHLSVTELNYESGPRTLELTVKIFTDDFESILSKTFNRRADFYNASYYSSMSEMVSKYIPARLAVRTDDQKPVFTYLGHELSGEAVYVFFQAEKVAPFRKLILRNTLLYDLFTDQISFVHSYYDGRRQTAKAVQPKDQFVFDW